MYLSGISTLFAVRSIKASLMIKHYKIV